MTYRNKHTGVILSPKSPDVEEQLAVSSDYEPYPQTRAGKGKGKKDASGENSQDAPEASEQPE